MAQITKNTSNIKYSEQEVLNKSKDDSFDILTVLTAKYSPANAGSSATLEMDTTDQLDLRVDETTTANMTYIGEASPGTATSEAKWRISRINETSGTVITYADSNTNFDNVWDNRASLSY